MFELKAILLGEDEVSVVAQGCELKGHMTISHLRQIFVLFRLEGC